MEAASGAFRKLSGKNELPMTEKPVVAAVESHWTTNSKNLLGKLDDKGIYVGDIPADKVGGIPSSYKPGIEHAIDKAVADGKITDATGDSLKSDLRFCGKDGAGDISGTTLGDDVGGGYNGGGVDGGDFDCDSSDLYIGSLLSFLGS